MKTHSLAAPQLKEQRETPIRHVKWILLVRRMGQIGLTHERQ